MAAGDVMDAAVVASAVVEADPAGEMCHWLCAGPVGVILVPGDDAAVPRGFAEKLVVPEADGAGEELAGGERERGVPEDVVKAGAEAPGTEGVEQDRVGLDRFVGVVFVPEVAAGVARVEKLGQLGAEYFDLLVGQDADAGQVAVLVVERDLVVGQAVLVPLGRCFGESEQSA